MTKRYHTKIVHEGGYVAEVDVEILDTGDGWSPYISLEDAQKLDDVREVLQKGALHKATNLAHVFKLIPVEVLNFPLQNKTPPPSPYQGSN